jgi:hypothetical protein
MRVLSTETAADYVRIFAQHAICIHEKSNFRQCCTLSSNMSGCQILAHEYECIHEQAMTVALLFCRTQTRYDTGRSYVMFTLKPTPK